MHWVDIKYPKNLHELHSDPLFLQQKPWTQSKRLAEAMH